MKDIKFTIFVIIMFTSIKGTLLQLLDFWPINVIHREIDSSVNAKDLTVGFTTLVGQNGYPAEEHQIQTKDYYRLHIHRMPGSRIRPKKPGKPVVYIQHGLFGLSNMFVLGGPNKDLAYMLTDAGYDVWFGNSRGNSYSRSHAVLSPDRDKEFWDFSFHEIAVYDMTATIDYILQETNQTSLIYVGHSMGTTLMLVLLSAKPEYNQKIPLVVNMASIGNWKKPGPIIKFLKDNGDIIKRIVLRLGIHEFFPHRVLRRILSNGTYCEEGVFQELCISLMEYLFGYNSDLDTDLIKTAFTHVPAGSSTKTLIHFHQNLVASKLQMFDYGLIENMARYGSLYPPPYNLKNIITRVAMIYGKGDTIADPADTMDLLEHLKNSWAESVPHEYFSHLDFVWGKDIKRLLQNRLLQIILHYKSIKTYK